MMGYGLILINAVQVGRDTQMIDDQNTYVVQSRITPASHDQGQERKDGL